MKDSIQIMGIREHERELRMLARSMAEGLAVAAKKKTGQTVFASAIRIEQAALHGLLKASNVPVSALECGFEAKGTGEALFLIPTSDLAQVGEIFSGVAPKAGSPLAPEAAESCEGYFSAAFAEFCGSLQEAHGLQVVAAPARLLNPDGKPAALLARQDIYAESCCMYLQLLVEPEHEFRIQLLMRSEKAAALAALLGAGLPAERPPAEARARGAAEADAAAAPAGAPVGPAQGGSQTRQGSWNLDLLLDVELPVAISFGESCMSLKDILRLGVGSIIELDKSVNDPVTVIVNQKPVASGEVVMVEGNYGVRILQVESTAERIRSLG